ncbi:MAG: peroxide stress protein YaaA [Candidatus Gracilibacteria bacterium]|nr:peroxide stress protein YaaA [Candidatus Gracilibacteria bacterium]
MKILFLIPPSEGKLTSPISPILRGSGDNIESITFNFDKPLEIAHNVCEKDLKCKGNRFLEGLELNKKFSNNISLLSQKESSKYEREGFGISIDAIHRYTGEMYKSINYTDMNKSAKKFFEQNFYIFSGMYGIVKPLDKIGNYKLPIESKGLYKYWWDIIPKAIIDMKPDYIVNLLPISYAKLIGEYTTCNRHKKKKETLINAGIKIINVNFVKQSKPPLTPPYQGENRTYTKVSHGVKKIKGEWIRHICENKISDYKKFGGEIVVNDNVINVNVIVNNG